MTTGSRVMAVYKGVTVSVYTVDKTEISLSRNDLIELINVRVLFVHFIQSFIHLLIFVSCSFLSLRAIILISVIIIIFWKRGPKVERRMREGRGALGAEGWVRNPLLSGVG